MGLNFDGGKRQTEYRFAAIRNGVELCPVQAVGAPRITMQSTAEIKTSISGTFVVPEEVDFLTDTLRPYMVVDGEEHQLGEYVITSVTEQRENGIIKMSVTGYDLGVKVKMSTLDSRIVSQWEPLYMDVIMPNLVTAGIINVIADPCEDHMQGRRTDWDVGTSRLTLINDLLQEINFDTLWFDTTGAARLTKYQAPSADNATKIYRADEMSVIRAGVTSELDIYEAYNDWIVVVNDANRVVNYPNNVVMTARATNDDPASKISVQRVGKRTAPIIYLNNIASQDALQEYVDKIKLQGMASTETVTWTTANMPHEVGEIVVLEHPQLQGVFEETAWTMTLQAGAAMTHTGKRLVYL